MLIELNGRYALVRSFTLTSDLCDALTVLAVLKLERLDDKLLTDVDVFNILDEVEQIHYPFDIGDASYFALAPGAGSGYMISRRWMLQGEYEYQLWLNSLGFANQPRHDLTPNGFDVGVVYRVSR